MFLIVVFQVANQFYAVYNRVIEATFEEASVPVLPPVFFEEDDEEEQDEQIVMPDHIAKRQRTE